MEFQVVVAVFGGGAAIGVKDSPTCIKKFGYVPNWVSTETVPSIVCFLK